MGVITNLTQNCRLIFERQKQELICRNVRKIIPKFMNDKHENLMKQWINTGSFRIVNQQKVTFATTNKNVCFKTIVYLQISTSFDRIKIYTMVLRLQGQNYLLLDRNMRIQGYGQKVKDSILSMKALNQPLKNYCLNYRVLPQQIQSLEENKKLYFEILLSDQKSTLGEIHSYNNKQANFLEQIKQFANKALRANREIRVLKCRIQLAMMKFGLLPHYVIKFLE